MRKIGHFVVTYTGRSWLAAQFENTPNQRSYLYSWTRTVDDSHTNNSDYRQLAPYLGKSSLGRRASLAVALIRERVLKGMSASAISAMRQDQIDLIHAHFGRAGFYALPIVRELKVPLVTSFYGYDVSEYPFKYPQWRENYKQLFQRQAYALCLGAVMREKIINLGCPPEKAIIHHLGVDMNRIEFRLRKWEKKTPLRVLIAAAFREKKGIPIALEALGRLKTDLPIEITIIGDAPNTAAGAREKQLIMSILDRYDLRPVTSIMGDQPYSALIAQAYQHHIFLSPSLTAQDGDMEGTPMVLVDMAASGIPIVSTTHSDIPEIIRHNETGFLAEERSVDQVLGYLRWYAQNPDEWQRITKVGRRYVEQEFDRSIQNQRLAKIYEGLIQ